MKKIFISILLSTFIVLTANADERMFHIARSKNANWVCYDARLKDGNLDMSDPVHVYWHNNSDNPGHENEISFFQRQMAFGYKVLSQGNNEVTIRLTAYKKRAMRVCKLKGHWVALININNTPAILKEVYVKTKTPNSLSVEYVTLTGVAVSTGKTIKETITN